MPDDRRADRKTQITNHNLQITIMYPVSAGKLCSLAQIRDFLHTNTENAQHRVPHADLTQITKHNNIFHQSSDGLLIMPSRADNQGCGYTDAKTKCLHCKRAISKLLVK